MEFEGVFTPLVTPFKDDFTCNIEVLDATVEHLIEAGVHGIVLGAAMGEVWSQSMKERVWLMGRVARLVDGRVPLVIGTGALRTEDCIEYAARARDAGASALLVSAPPFRSLPAADIVAYVEDIHDASDLPILLDADPGRMDAACLDVLSALDRVCARMDVASDPVRVGRPALCCGSEAGALAHFAWGARCLVSAMSNFAPEACLALYKACAVEGDFERGRAIATALRPVAHVIEHGAKPVQTVKYGLSLCGRVAGPPRRPLQPLIKREIRDVEALFADMTDALAEVL